MLSHLHNALTAEWFWPGVWGVLVMGYATAAIFGVYGWLQGPSLGLSVSFSDGGPIVSRLQLGSEPWVVGMRAGDRVLTVDGGLPSEASWPVPEGPKAIEVRSATTSETLSVDYRGGSARALGPSLETVAAIFAVVGMLVFLRAYRSAEIVAFSLFALAAAAALAIAPAGLLGHIWARVASLASSTGAAALFFVFFLQFGAKEETSAARRVKPLIVVALVVPLGLAIALVAGLRGPEPAYTAARTAALGVIVGGFFAGCAALVARYRRTRDDAVREQIRTVLVGTLLGVAPFLLLSILPYVISGTYIVRPHVTALGAALIPLSFAYAILRYRLLGIRRLVHRAVAYGALTAVLLVAYSVAISLLRAIAADSRPPVAIEIGLFLLLIAGVPLIAGARRTASAFVDRVMYRGETDPREIVRGLGLDIAPGGDLPALAREVLGRVVNGLSLEFAAYVVRVGEAGNQIVARVGKATDAEILAQLGGELVWRRTNASVWGMGGASAEGGPLLAGSVRGLEGNVGVAVLGPKSSGESFGPEDALLLQTASGLLSAAATRGQLTEEVDTARRELADMDSRLANAEEHERAELASYLHDEPLQKVSYALAQFRERALPDDLATLLEQVAKDLRSTSARLGPDLLRDLGLVRAVEWLAQEAEQQGQFRVFFDAAGLSAEQRFRPEVELTAYRTVQEALTNCRKHSGAKAVWVELGKSGETLNVLIQDNGTGVAPPAGAPGQTAPHLGLSALRRRIELLGGRLDVGTRKPRGTRVMATVPLQSAATGNAPDDAGDERQSH